MKKLTIALLVVVAVAGGAGWFYGKLRSGPATPPPPAAKGPDFAVPSFSEHPTEAPAAAGNAGGVAPNGSVVYVRGKIQVPPLLAKFLATKHDVLLSLQGYVQYPSANPANNIFRLAEDIEVKGWPYTFNLRVKANMAPLLLGRERPELFIRALVCFDLPPRKDAEPIDQTPLSGQCNFRSVPYFVGFLKFRPDASVEDPPNREISVFAAPPLVLTRIRHKPDPAACTLSRGTISGTIEPTRAFLRIPKRAKTYELLAVPLAPHRPPEPFTNEAGEGALTKADLAKLSQAGIARMPIILTDEEPVPFRLELPEAQSGAAYDLYLNACKDGESEDDCTQSAFPVGVLSNDRGNETLFRLVPGGFETPQCGTTGMLFYLHHWMANPPPITLDVLQNSAPPELIEGAYF